MKNSWPQLGIIIFLFIMILFPACDGVVPHEPPTGEETPDEEVRPPTSWTIFLYMLAESSIETKALEAINLLEAGMQSSTNINIVVLIDRSTSYSTGDGNWDGTRLYEIIPDTLNQTIVSKRLSDSELGISSSSKTELDLSDSENLRLFLNFGTEVFPAEKYAMIFWGYSEGISGENHAILNPVSNYTSRAIGYDSSSDRQLLPIREIAAKFQVHNFDVVCFDAPKTNLLEFAYEFKGRVPYYIGSQDAEDSGKWNYKNLIERFSQTPQTQTDFVTAVIDSYAETHGSDNKFSSIAAIDTEKLGEVMINLNTFLQAASNQITDDNRTTIRQGLFYLQDWGYVTPGEMQLDLLGMVKYLNAQGIATLHATAVESAINKAISGIWGPQSGPSMSGLSLFYTSLLSNGAATYSLPETYFQDTSKPALRFVKESNWVPDANTKTGFLYRLWYEQ